MAVEIFNAGRIIHRRHSSTTTGYYCRSGLVSALGMHLPAGPGANLTQGGDEPLAVKVIFEDRLPPVPAIHHMINRTGIFNPHLTWHVAV